LFVDQSVHFNTRKNTARRDRWLRAARVSSAISRRNYLLCVKPR